MSRVKHLLLGGFISLLALVCWSTLLEPRWVAQRHEHVRVAQWKGPAGLKVAVAGDWHLTKRALWRVMTVERARQIVQDINVVKPDVILLPGDFIADSDYLGEGGVTAEDEIASVLGELRAPLGVYAVLGNHDWWHNGSKFTDALQRKGIQVLENDAVQLPNTSLWVVGVGDDFTGHSQPRRAMAKVPPGAHSVVFMHDPASLRELPTAKGLVVAAHTEGRCTCHFLVRLLCRVQLRTHGLTGGWSMT
jgi:uncharacterized protein